jgi:hypothetical protein
MRECRTRQTGWIGAASSSSTTLKVQGSSIAVFPKLQYQAHLKTIPNRFLTKNAINWAADISL